MKVVIFFCLLVFFGHISIAIEKGSKWGPGLHDPEYSPNDYERVNGPMDRVPPKVKILHPKGGEAIYLNEMLTVEIQATDNVKVDAMSATFDVDGSGKLDDIACVNGAGILWECKFMPLSGKPGERILSVFATDPTSNLAGS
jgi:hypothetical protein